MDSPVSKLMARSVQSAYTEDSVEKVEALMTRHRLSSVPVVDKDDVVFGILSSGDLVRFHSEKKDAKRVLAWELCTLKPFSVSPETSMEEVARLMLSKKVHHVLVTQGKELKGVISTFDLLEHWLAKI